MRFEDLKIHGAKLVHIEPHTDVRGFFARTFCAAEFEKHQLSGAVSQASISYNAKGGTVRGMHLQWPPSREDKLVRCLRGGLFDVLIDLRPDSPTYLRHESVILDQDNRDAVFIPTGIAHGFQTLADDTEVLYQMTDTFAPLLQTGFRWNDAAFGISWPLPVSVISDRDAGEPDFVRGAYESEYAARLAGRVGAS